MFPAITGLPTAAALLLCLAFVPQARSSDRPQENQADAIEVPETDVENAAPVEEADANKAKPNEPAIAAAAATEGPAKDAEDWVCRKETPTGSHRSIKVCRRAADIEASSQEVGQVMNRQRHYGNPSVTPEG